MGANFDGTITVHWLQN